jgi:hypothetical protein
VIPFLRWKPWQLLTAAAVLALAGPTVLAFLNAVMLNPYGAGIGFVLYGSYPITVWMALVFAGLALGRLHVETIRTALIALGAGAVLLVIGYGLGGIGWATGFGGPVDGVLRGGDTVESGWAGYPQALADADPLRAVLGAILGVEPHSGGTAEILGSGGFAVMVIAVCLLLSRPLRWPLLPLGALGSMPLTAYSVHVVSIVLIAGPGAFIADNGFWAATAAGLLLLATVWSMFLGRGLLERMVGAGATAMASVPRR